MPQKRSKEQTANNKMKHDNIPYPQFCFDDQKTDVQLALYQYQQF